MVSTPAAFAAVTPSSPSALMAPAKWVAMSATEAPAAVWFSRRFIAVAALAFLVPAFAFGIWLAHSPQVLDASGRWECASPQITVRYGFSPMTVYVAREFPPGSCAYREIHAHEMRHVRAYQDHLKAIEKPIADALQARFAGTAPWRGPKGEANARLQQELQERWVPYVKREINKVDAAQALIDTPEEYARVAESCNGEVRRLTR